MGGGHPHGLHVGDTVTVGVIVGQHLGHAIGTVSVESRGQA